MKETLPTRPPAVAGFFYPADRAELTAVVDGLLALAASVEPDRRIRGIVSPHAGYAYSGAVAAHGFRAMDSGAIDTVVLVGPSHVEGFDFTSVFEGSAYRTPLGDVPVDTILARALVSTEPSIRLSPRGHVQPRLSRGEHGLEVQLPFLQRVAPRVSIVPVVMGSQSWEACEALGRSLAGACDPRRTILLASSDLSHFHSYKEAVRLDAVFCDVLSTLDAEALGRALRDGRCEACGGGPVIATVLALRAWGADSCRVLTRINSGDVTNERDSVVGYASAVVTTVGPT